MQTIVRYTKQFIQYVRNNSAVSALEYAILVGVIVVAAAVAMTQFTSDMKTSIDEIGKNVKTKTKTVGTN